MIRMTILYPNTPGSTFDADYYRSKHLPLGQKLMGSAVKGMELDVGIASAAGPAPYHAAGHFLFESMESFQQAFPAAAGQLREDVPRYTNVEPVVLFSEYEKLL